MASPLSDRLKRLRMEEVESRILARDDLASLPDLFELAGLLLQAEGVAQRIELRGKTISAYARTIRSLVPS